MTKSPKTISTGKLAAEAVPIMENATVTRISVLPVVNAEHRPAGLIHLHDIIDAGIDRTHHQE